VFEAWTKPEHVAQWWGPNGFSTTISEMDVRPGGVWRHVMHGPGGRDYVNNIVFLEVVRPERIVYKHQPEKGTEPVNHETTVTFADRGGKTEVTLRMLFASTAARKHIVKTYRAIEGGTQTLGRLAGYVAKTSGAKAPVEREIVIERVFDAPRELVWRAWTDPKVLAQWWGPRGFTNPVCEVDLRVGGAFRIHMRAPDGAVYPMRGVFLESDKPEDRIFTNIAVDKDDNPILNGLTIVTFAEEGGKTKLTLKTGATAVVDYAAEYLKGMEAGWTQSFEKLAELLAKSGD